MNASLTMIFITIATLLLSSPTSQTTLPPPPAQPPDPHFVNLTDLLSLAGPFRTFLPYLIDTQVIETFQNQANNSNQGITLFAPSDSAFSSLTDPSLPNITKDQLKSLLLFHAFPKFYTLTGLMKNLSGLSVATMAGGDFELNITDFSGSVKIESGWSHTSISSSVYASMPVAVYTIDQVLIPEKIFGSAPAETPTPIASPSTNETQTPPDLVESSGRSPQPSEEETSNKSFACKMRLGDVTGFSLVISSVLMLLL